MKKRTEMKLSSVTCGFSPFTRTNTHFYKVSVISMSLFDVKERLNSISWTYNLHSRCRTDGFSPFTRTNMHFYKVSVISMIIFDFFWSFVLFIAVKKANDLRLRRIFYPRFYPLHIFSYLNSSERASMFLMFSAKQAHYWYHFYNVFGMRRSLTGDWTRDLPHSMPALYH